MGLATTLIQPPAEADVADAVRAALAEIRRNGITSVQDMDGSGANVRRALFRLYQHLAHTGRLTVRVRLYGPLGAWNNLAQVGVALGFGDLWVTIGSLLGFIDVSLGTSSDQVFAPVCYAPSVASTDSRALIPLQH